MRQGGEVDCRTDADSCATGVDKRPWTPDSGRKCLGRRRTKGPQRLVFELRKLRKLLLHILRHYHLLRQHLHGCPVRAFGSRGRRECRGRGGRGKGRSLLRRGLCGSLCRKRRCLLPVQRLLLALRLLCLLRQNESARMSHLRG